MAWLLSPSRIQNAIGFCVATYPFYDPLAHGVEKIFAAEWDGCMSLVVQGTVGRIGEQRGSGEQLLRVYTWVSAREGVDVHVDSRVQSQSA